MSSGDPSKIPSANTSSMLALLRRLKVEMNGAVTGAMEQGGIKYGINYGVSIPTIGDIAGEYGKDHSLALFLFRQDVRELKLAALFIDDPQEVDLAQMREWGAGIDNTELAEQVSMRLFSKSPAAHEISMEWFADENPFLRYTAFMTASRFVKDGHADARQINLLTEGAVSSLNRFAPDHNIVNGAVSLFIAISRTSPTNREKVMHIAAKLSLSPNNLQKHIGTELTTLTTEIR